MRDEIKGKPNILIVSNHDNPRELKTTIKPPRGAIFSQFRV